MFCGHVAPKPGYYVKSAAKLSTAALVGFCAFELLTGDEKFYRNIAIPVVHRLLDAEKAHRFGVLTAKYHLLPLKGSLYKKYEKELGVECFGLKFENAIGIAAGFDKDGEAIDGLSQLGLGFVEIGSVTPDPQPGNEKPRVFRLSEDLAVINRYGFNSSGHQFVEKQLLKSERKNSKCLLGINLGKNKQSTDPEGDFARGYSKLAPYADYVVINVSSPNTPGLRNMQTAHALRGLLTRLKESKKSIVGAHPPLLLKVAPDLSMEEKEGVASLCLDPSWGVSGLIVTNTTVQRPKTLHNPHKCESGGLSGAPLRRLSTQCVKDFRRLTRGRVPIVACGGVDDGRSAYEKIRAGASLVQLYTAIVYQGFPVFGRIKRELVECLKEDGFDNIEQAIGIDCPV